MWIHCDGCRGVLTPCTGAQKWWEFQYIFTLEWKEATNWLQREKVNVCVSGILSKIFPIQITSEIKGVIKKKKKKSQEDLLACASRAVVFCSYTSRSNLLVYFRCWEGISGSCIGTAGSAEVIRQREKCAQGTFKLLWFPEQQRRLRAGNLPLQDPDSNPRSSSCLFHAWTYWVKVAVAVFSITQTDKQISTNHNPFPELQIWKQNVLMLRIWMNKGRFFCRADGVLSGIVQDGATAGGLAVVSDPWWQHKAAMPWSGCSFIICDGGIRTWWQNRFCPLWAALVQEAKRMCGLLCTDLLGDFAVLDYILIISVM